jgi:hypothetical protein
MIWFPVIQVWRNGVLQTSGVDYGGVGTALTFFPNSIPQPGLFIEASYLVCLLRKAVPAVRAVVQA